MIPNRSYLVDGNSQKETHITSNFSDQTQHIVQIHRLNILDSWPVVDGYKVSVILFPFFVHSCGEFRNDKTTPVNKDCVEIRIINSHIYL